MKLNGIKTPRVAVQALNPHAEFGKEEKEEILCVLDRYYHLEWYWLVCIFVHVENEHLEVQLGLYDQQWLVIIYTNMHTQVPHHNL